VPNKAKDREFSHAKDEKDRKDRKIVSDNPTFLKEMVGERKRNEPD